MTTTQRRPFGRVAGASNREIDMIRYIESKDGKAEGHLITLLPGKEVEFVKAVKSAVSDLRPEEDSSPLRMGLLISDADVRAMSGDGRTEKFFAHMFLHLEKSGVIGLDRE